MAGKPTTEKLGRAIGGKIATYEPCIWFIRYQVDFMPWVDIDAFFGQIEHKLWTKHFNDTR